MIRMTASYQDGVSPKTVVKLVVQIWKSFDDGLYDITPKVNQSFSSIKKCNCPGMLISWI
jgi:hypothetical protein